MISNQDQPEEISAETEVPEPEATAEADKPEWKFKNRLPIQDRMTEVILLTKSAAEKELESLHKKLRKMQYGS